MNTFSDPQKIIEQCDIFPGQHIADLGAGSGVYTIAIAEKIEGDARSRVFAIDIQKDLLARIDNLAKEKKLSSVHVVWGDIEENSGTRLKEGSINTALVANTLFQTEKPKKVIEEAKRILHHDGRLIIIDWSESFGNIGPTEKDIMNEKIVVDLCEKEGFTFEKTIDAGEHHYGLIMRRK